MRRRFPAGGLKMAMKRLREVMEWLAVIVLQVIFQRKLRDSLEKTG